MNNEKLRFAIFGNEFQAKKSLAIHKIVAILQQHEAEIIMDRPFYKFVTEGQHMDISVDEVFEGDDFNADFAISMGGDGTLLKTAARVYAKSIPVVGVNIGRLGFLADVNPSDIEKAVTALYKGKYKVHEHNVIKIETENGDGVLGSPYALNDIAVLKRDLASMISIRVNVNNDYLMTYQADGLIVTTPTGSTAYSLSNGGPIITPGTNTMCLTAVAPHSLNVRPIVVPDTAVITLKVESRSHNFLVAVDGR
ncbi:MAG: NAD kinase, partial [Prevotella sp.]|nr:NAD kinase [Prevotella sp.]